MTFDRYGRQVLNSQFPHADVMSGTCWFMLPNGMRLPRGGNGPPQSRFNAEGRRLRPVDVGKTVLARERADVHELT